MRISFPMSIPTIPKVDVSSVYVGFDTLLESEGFAKAMNAKRRNGARLVQFGGYNDGIEADTVIAWNTTGFQMLCDRPVDEQDKQYGIVVFPEVPYARKSWFDFYQKACKNQDVSVIAIAPNSLASDPPMDGFLRIVYLSRLIADGRFCSEKLHWLYGVPNPAELSVYGEMFSNFITSRFELAICSTCFLYSVFGILFSVNTGVMHRLEEICDTRVADLGMYPWVDYEMSREQMRCFHMNVDTVQSFADGLVADDYMDRVRIILEEGVVHAKAT